MAELPGPGFLPTPPTVTSAKRQSRGISVGKGVPGRRRPCAGPGRSRRQTALEQTEARPLAQQRTHERNQILLFLLRARILTERALIAQARLQPSRSPALNAHTPNPPLHRHAWPWYLEQTDVADRSSRIRLPLRFKDWMFGIEQAGARQLVKRFGTQRATSGTGQREAIGRHEELRKYFAQKGGPSRGRGGEPDPTNLQ